MTPDTCRLHGQAPAAGRWCAPPSPRAAPWSSSCHPEGQAVGTGRGCHPEGTAGPGGSGHVPTLFSSLILFPLSEAGGQKPPCLEDSLATVAV